MQTLALYNNDCQPTNAGRGRCEARQVVERNTQHDAHVRNYNTFVRAYGSMEGYYLMKARKAMSNAQLMLTPSGRDFIWRRNNKHSEYRRERA